MRTISTSELRELGIIVNSFNPRAPSPIHTREHIEGRYGFIDLGTVYDGRIIDSKLTMIAKDYLDYPLLKNKVFSLFDSRQYFYLIHDEKGKRWKVKYNYSYSIERIANVGEMSIEFISDSAFAESIGTTLDPLTFEVEKWQVGQGLKADDLSYVHSTNNFSIYNASDTPIDPREIPLVIKYNGASNNLIIRNKTTGDEWQYFSSSNSNDVIELNRIRSLKNGTSIFRQTNRKVISIAEGFNEFELIGTTGSFLITFDFRFYYL